jgi:ribosomal protein L37AE/L43A
MLEREHGDIVWCCDGCGEVLDTHTGDFDAARNVLTRNRWRAQKRDDEWTHLCPDCQRR